jgi:transposase
MAGQRRKFSREFKVEAVRRVESGEPTAEVARALGIHPNMLGGWVRQLRANEKEAFRGNGKLTSRDEEIRRLKRQLVEVTDERDILKKAAAYFAKESR